MTDPYAHEERIAIRIDSGMSALQAEELTNQETFATSDLAKRIDALAHRPKPLHVPSHEPVVTGKELAGGVK